MNSLFYNTCKIFALSLLLLAPCLSVAAESKAQETSIEGDWTSVPFLPTVTVEATRLDPLTGKSTLDRDQIESIPSRNSNTSDLLKLMPGVQMPESAESSNTAGEIVPAAVSISGGRPYDNNFLIDGVGNNSLLDPRESNSDIISDVPGHPQELFLHNGLLSEITVLRSNIPARYGGFTGGVIDARTIDPAEIFSGTLSYRATDSDWSEFHIDDSNQTDFKNSNNAKYQPEFTKQNVTATLHTPFTANSGLVLSYSLLHSKIPLQNLDAREVQSRSSENFFAKYQNRFDGTKTFSLSALYAPYTRDDFIKNVKDSTYQGQGGGLNLTTKVQNISDAGNSEITLAYKNSFNSRRSPDNFLSWRNTVNKDWGVSTTSKEGGYGDIDKEQHSVSASLHHQFNGVRLANSIHNVSAGLESEWADTKYNRKRDMAIFIAKADASVDCAGDNSDCVDNEQYFYKRTIYPEDNATADIFQVTTYLEDSIQIKRLTLRPGARVTWDDYLENINISPRLAAGYDLYGNGRTTFIAGANRYYGGNLLTMNLAQQKQPFSRYTRGLNGTNNPDEDWGVPVDGINTFKQTADLKTPHTDEWTIGVRQNLSNGILELDYIERYGRDLLVTNRYDSDPGPAKKYLKEWRNDGRSHHQEANISWITSWPRHELTITSTWQKTRGDSSSYADSFIESDESLDELIWYNGKIGTKDELLLDDYNRPFRASLLYTVQLGSRFTFSNTTTYRSPYKSAEISKSKHTLPDGTEIDIYEDVTNDQALIFDWRLVLDAVRSQRMTLGLTLDIYNVFNQETNLGGSTTDYELGRQVWLGAECRF